MQGHQAHLSDEELLLFSDQELAPRPASIAREHVAQCERCRGRLNKLDGASAEFADLQDQAIQALGADSAEARNVLRARLSEVSVLRSTPRSATLGNIVTRQLASASLALLLVVGGTWAAREMMRTRSTSDVMRAEAIALPRRALTPGSVRAVEIADLCSTGDADNDPPVNPSLEQAVFKEYGLPASSTENYALDYLITPALGGSDSIQNLWPEPYSATWNSRVKDQLEDHLHQLVCQGKVQLTTAQSDIATDWIAAYKRYFKTDKPGLGLATTASVGLGYDLEPQKNVAIATKP